MSDPDPAQLAAAVQAQQQVTPMQEVYSAFSFDVQTQPDGTRLLVIESMLPRKAMIFQFGKLENAEALGKKLLAPGVVMPSQNGNGRHA